MYLDCSAQSNGILCAVDISDRYLLCAENLVGTISEYLLKYLCETIAESYFSIQIDKKVFI